MSGSHTLLNFEHHSYTYSQSIKTEAIDNYMPPRKPATTPNPDNIIDLTASSPPPAIKQEPNDTMSITHKEGMVDKIIDLTVDSDEE